MCSAFSAKNFLFNSDGDGGAFQRLRGRHVTESASYTKPTKIWIKIHWEQQQPRRRYKKTDPKSPLKQNANAIGSARVRRYTLIYATPLGQTPLRFGPSGQRASSFVPPSVTSSATSTPFPTRNRIRTLVAQSSWPDAIVFRLFLFIELFVRSLTLHHSVPQRCHAPLYAVPPTTSWYCHSSSFSPPPRLADDEQRYYAIYTLLGTRAEPQFAVQLVCLSVCLPCGVSRSAANRRVCRLCRLWFDSF